MASHPEDPNPDLPTAVAAALEARAITARDEVRLRRTLEAHVPSYTLCRLPPVAARRWRAHYRVLLGTGYLDAQTASEAYARALLTVLGASDPATHPQSAP